MSQDETLEHILSLHGERFVIDDELGLWVKFEIKKTPRSLTRSRGGLSIRLVCMIVITHGF